MRDLALAIAMTALTLYGAVGEAHPAQPGDQVQIGYSAPPTAAYLLVVIAALVLAVRRLRPRQVLWISTAAVAIYSVLGYVNGAALLNPIVALYSAAAATTARRAAAWALTVLVVLTAATAINNPLGTFGGAIIVLPGLVAAALFAGIAVSNRRAYIDELRVRAHEETRRQVDQERLRIARELHDVVAHTMATINVSAGVALHVIEQQPQVAAEALATIKAASKDGLRELRAVLSVLRQADEAEATRPAPGLGQLQALISAGSRAGLTTTLTIIGQSRPLPAEVDLTAYRILQEALTNVIRHAGPTTANITVDYRADEVLLSVTDTGRAGSIPAGSIPTGSTGSGHGLIGMAERAASVAGRVEAGRRPGGGFGVHARLPIQPSIEPSPQGQP